MAGITNTLPFKLIPARTSTTLPYLPPPLFSLNSKLFGFRLSNSNSLRLDRPPASISFAPVPARYGSGDSRGNRNDSEDVQVINLDNIRSDPAVRLYDENQNMVGIVSTSQAIQMAKDAELDLVIVSPDADPPVVRITEFNKYIYEQQKKKREQQKKSAANRTHEKELKMGYSIDQHDYSVRLKAAQKFLKDGDKVKVTVHLRGRQNEFKNIADELVRRFGYDIGELARVQHPKKKDKKHKEHKKKHKNFCDEEISIVLVPNKAVLQKAQGRLKKKDKSAAAADEVSSSVQA